MASEGEGAVLDGGGLSRVLRVSGGARLTLARVHLHRGAAPSREGGGGLVEDSGLEERCGSEDSALRGGLHLAEVPDVYGRE